MDTTYDLSTSTPDFELEPLERLLLNSTELEVVDIKEELAQLLRPLAANGCTYQNWLAHGLLARAAAATYRQPIGEYFDTVQLKFFKKAGLSRMTEEGLVVGMAFLTEQADAKAAAKKAFKKEQAEAAKTKTFLQRKGYIPSDNTDEF
jgi:hypothetical protein